MVSSMTAFSRKENAADWGTLTWEIRSVNHRYLELVIRLPDALRYLESLVRETLQKTVRRGKVDVYLRYQAGEASPYEIQLNTGLMEQLAAVTAKASATFPDASLNLMDILNWQGMLKNKYTHLDEVEAEVKQSLHGVVADMVAMRDREGAKLCQFIESRLSILQEHIVDVTKLYPMVQQKVRDKIVSRFEEVSLTLDPERLEQEMVWFAQKLDVAEELSRLEMHIEEVRRVMKGSDSIGRRLDFLMQELNREANTLSSKSIDAKITQVAVDMKVQIEQMREQVQNIE